MNTWQGSIYNVQSVDVPDKANNALSSCSPVRLLRRLSTPPVNEGFTAAPGRLTTTAVILSLEPARIIQCDYDEYASAYNYEHRFRILHNEILRLTVKIQQQFESCNHYSAAISYAQPMPPFVKASSSSSSATSFWLASPSAYSVLTHCAA